MVGCCECVNGKTRKRYKREFHKDRILNPLLGNIVYDGVMDWIWKGEQRPSDTRVTGSDKRLEREWGNRNLESIRKWMGEHGWEIAFEKNYIILLKNGREKNFFCFRKNGVQIVWKYLETTLDYQRPYGSHAESMCKMADEGMTALRLMPNVAKRRIFFGVIHNIVL